MTRGIASRMRGRMRMSVRRVESAAGLVMEGRARGEREWRVAMPRWRAWMIICWMLCVVRSRCCRGSTLCGGSRDGERVKSRASPCAVERCVYLTEVTCRVMVESACVA